MIKEWVSVLKGKQTTLEEKRRANICVKCNHHSTANFLKWFENDIKEINGLYCNLCKCPLVAKIKTTDKKHICKKWL